MFISHFDSERFHYAGVFGKIMISSKTWLFVSLDKNVVPKLGDVEMF